MFMVAGAPDTTYQRGLYHAYYAAIAAPPPMAPPSSSMAPCDTPVHSRHQLLPDVGEGSIDIVETAAQLRVVRYDASFQHSHILDYEFPSDRFELEVCLGGRMTISERSAGEGELTSGGLSVAPLRETKGSITFPAGERYRAVSISGSYSALAPYLGTVGPERFRNALRRVGGAPGAVDRAYLGAGSGDLELSGLAGGLYADIAEFSGRLRQPGVRQTLGLESLITACLSRLVDDELFADGAPGARSAKPPERPVSEHEVSVAHRIPDLLWRHRRDLPTVSELAVSLAMSPRRLAAVHRTVFGTTVMEHHRRRCTEEACRLLATTSWTVEHIAHECGYTSASNFIFAFRRRVGRTPGEYRREMGSGTAVS